MMQSYNSNKTTQTVPGTFITKNLFTWVKIIPVMCAVWVSTIHQSEGKIQIRLGRYGGGGVQTHQTPKPLIISYDSSAFSSFVSPSVLHVAPSAAQSPSQSHSGVFTVPLSFNNLLYWALRVDFFFWKKRKYTVEVIYYPSVIHS